MFVLLKIKLWNILSDMVGQVTWWTSEVMSSRLLVLICRLTWIFKYFHTFLSLVYLEDVCSVSAVFLEPLVCFVCSVTTTNQ